MPLRVGDDLLASAKLAAEATGRSAAQQIGYWAKLGRELERSGSVSVREVAEVLAGARSYDDLDPKAQATVRGKWDARIETRRTSLNLAERFTAEGRSWVEAGADGTTVRHGTAEQGRPLGRRQRAAGAATRNPRSVRGIAEAKTTKRTSTSKSIATKTLVTKTAAKAKASSRSR